MGQKISPKEIRKIFKSDNKNITHGRGKFIILNACM